MDRLSLQKIERMRLDREVGAVLEGGARLSGEFVTLVWKGPPKTDDSRGMGLRKTPRLAIRVPKAAGNAVQRNRIRRLIREVFRRERDHILSGTDLVWLVRPQTRPTPLDYEQVRQKMIELCRKAGLWTEAPSKT